jgi:hypothetical protein
MREWGAARRAFERVTLERLERVASRTVAGRILETALRLAGARAVPEEPVGFGLFVTGALHDAVHARLGPEVAEAVVEDLSGFFALDADAMNASGVRRRERRDRRHERVVLVASINALRVEAIRADLPDDVEALAASDVFSLLQLAEGMLDRSLTLVMDGTLPGLRGPMLLTLSRVLPPTARLLFWGEPPPTDIPLDATTVPAEATASEVAALCLDS